MFLESCITLRHWMSWEQIHVKGMRVLTYSTKKKIPFKNKRCWKQGSNNSRWMAADKDTNNLSDSGISFALKAKYTSHSGAGTCSSNTSSLFFRCWEVVHQQEFSSWPHSNLLLANTIAHLHLTLSHLPRTLRILELSGFGVALKISI